MLQRHVRFSRLVLGAWVLLLPLTLVSAQDEPLNSSPQGCVENYDPSVNYFPDQVTSDYALEWDVAYFNNYKVITVATQVSGVNGTYVLVQCGTPAPELTGDLEGAIPFEVPIQTLWEGGGGTYAAIEALGVAEQLVGLVVVDNDLRYTPAIYSRAIVGDLPVVNYGESNEPIVAAQPDLYLQYEADEDRLGKRAVGIPIVHYDPFSESPLGSAEQVKFLSLFYNLEARANGVFTPIETRYLALRELALAQPERPTVLLGNIAGEGTTFRSREPERLDSILIQDAGGELVQQGVDLPFEKAFIGIDYDLESVIALASDAEYWFGMHYTPAETTTADGKNTYLYDRSPTGRVLTYYPHDVLRAPDEAQAQFEHIIDAPKSNGVILQTYMDGVAEGEYSLTFFGLTLSHAVQKPLGFKADRSLDRRYVEPDQLPVGMFDYARTVIDELERRYGTSSLTRTRVDLFVGLSEEDERCPIVSEVEFVEPNTNIRIVNRDKGEAEREKVVAMFADAIEKRISELTNIAPQKESE